MFLIGILAVLQITLLPGLVVLHLFKLKTDGILQKTIYVFALSLFINYSIVTILTLLGLYYSIVVFIIIALEVLYILWLIRIKRIIIPKNLAFRELLQRYFSVYRKHKLIPSLIILAASIVLLFYFSLIISNLGTIFYFVDTVNNIHWNTWAIDFSNNLLPRQSHHFPQLLPANWSIAYLLTGNPEINFFPKSIMPLFFFCSLLMFLDLAITKKSLIFLVGLIIYGLFAPIIFSLVFIADGNADIPVSFFAFLTFYSYLKTDKNRFNIDEYFLIFLFAASAAATKLAGIYIFLVASLISLYELIKNWKSIKKSDLIWRVILVFFVLGISFFWHLLRPEVMTSSLHQPQYVGDNYLQIFTKAAELMYFNWGLPVVVFFILTIIGSFFVKPVRYVTLILVLPPLLIWMLKYSVDFRNLSFVVPFISYVSAFGFIKLIEKAANKSVDVQFNFDAEIISVSTRRKFLSWAIIVFLIVTYFIIGSDLFYNFLFKLYKFISVYYFQSYRINLLVDYTPLVNVDFYQNVLSVMILTCLGFLILSTFNIRLKQLLIALVCVALFFNFTFANESSIIRHHKKLTERVAARNYSAWMEPIVKSKGLTNKIYTNFEAISLEKLPVELIFIYADSDQIEKYLNTKNSNTLYFIKFELLSKEMRRMIEERLSQNEYETLFSDGEYILFQ